MACTEGKALHDHMTSHYKELLAYLDSLPIILENEDFIFVHGGYAKEADPAKDESKFLKYDNYNELSGVNDKPVIVGHWPASNLRSHRFTNLPKFNKEKKIITIDGGLGVKSSGELNALIIEKKNGLITYRPLQVNDFAKAKILSEHHFQEEDPIYVSFPHFEVDVLERKGDFVLCRHQHTQKPLSVFPSLLEEENGQTRIKTTYINAFLNLKKGDEVEVCLRFDDCALVKFKNDFGWVLREQIS
jgi:protein phosphatase